MVKAGQHNEHGDLQRVRQPGAEGRRSGSEPAAQGARQPASELPDPCFQARTEPQRPTLVVAWAAVCRVTRTLFSRCVVIGVSLSVAAIEAFVIFVSWPDDVCGAEGIDEFVGGEARASADVHPETV